MKKIITMLLVAVMILALAACAPKDGNGTTAGTDPVANGPVHCVCGAAEGQDHIGDCTGEKVAWTAWDGDTLPTESGYYYAAHEADEVALKYMDYTLNPAPGGQARNIVIDLNGKTFKAPGDQFVILDGAMTLTITDSSDGYKGSIASDPDKTASRVHALFHLADIEEETTATLNVYRVTLDASAVEDSEKDGAAISVLASNALNMYNATVRGGSVIGNGGAIYNAGTATLRDCVIYGAEVKNTEEDSGVSVTGLGGAISTQGDLNLIDCTIYGAEAGRGGAMNVAGGTTVMEGGTIYGANVTKAACAINMKSMSEDAEVKFIMKSSAKGDPLIDCSQNASGSFGGAINIDGYVATAEFTMESGEIKGGRTIGAAGGGAIILQDTLNEGADMKGIFIMNGGTITGGFTDAETGRGGGAIAISTGGALYLNGGTVTGGKDLGANKAGGIFLRDTACKMVIGGTAQVTGNEGCDVFVGTGKSIIVKDDWAGNGDTPLVLSLQDGKGAFAAADEGATLTEAFAAYFSTEAGTVKLNENTLVIE